MPRKKSIQLSTHKFKEEVDDTLEFLSVVSIGQSKRHISLLYDLGIIRLYSAFENFMLDCLVGAINNDTTVLSQKNGYKFPKHLSKEVCRYIIIGNGYFDFKGKGGLIKILKRYVPESHFLVTNVRKREYSDALEQVSALRNFAAHGSSKSKKAALEAVGAKRMGSSGSWLKVNNRFAYIADRLGELATDIENAAPY